MYNLANECLWHAYSMRVDSDMNRLEIEKLKIYYKMVKALNFGVANARA